MKKILFFLLIAVGNKLTSQNKQILYGFDRIPQTLLINPGVKTNYKYHIGIPLLSGISANVNASGITIADLFRDDNIDFTTKLDNTINNLERNDYAYINSQIEVLSAGCQLNKKDYLSVGFYNELDVFLTIPKDLLKLTKDGNAGFINKRFLFSDIVVKADLLGVIHAGISRKFNGRLIAGARMKIYSGILNVTSTGNRGSLTTRLSPNSIYEYSLNNIDIAYYSSGLSGNSIDKNVRKLFSGNNLGVGFDIGFTYLINDQTEISGSLLDIGFINYSDKINNTSVNGNFTFTGIEFQYDGTNRDYWQELEDKIKGQLSNEDNQESYSVMRPLKFNFALKYSFGKSRGEESCSDMSFNNYYNNSVGIQTYSMITPIGPRLALTGFYERKLSEILNTKITYTVDDFSYSNIGLGISANIWKLNLYGLVDNILKLSDIADTNSSSFQFGISILFK